MSQVLNVFSIIMLTTLPGVTNVTAQDNNIRFSGLDWSTEHATVTTESFMGREALTIQSGALMLEHAELTDGIIRVDIASLGRFSFGGILFRAVDHENTEEVYLRLNKSGLPDAVQYTPRHNGIAEWQLYNGNGYTAAANFPNNEWLTLKLHIKGDSVFTFLGKNPSPIMRSGLIRSTEGDKIGLWAIAGAKFSNFSYQLEEPIEEESTITISPKPTMLTEWEISEVYPASVLENYDLTNVFADANWDKIGTDNKGLVNISTMRHKKESGESGDATVIARTIISADIPQTVKLSFGYSDMIRIYVDGNPVFEANSKWRSRDIGFNGIVGLNDHLILNLDEGEHELVFAVTEWFGGWGFMAEMEVLDKY